MGQYSDYQQPLPKTPHCGTAMLLVVDSQANMRKTLVSEFQAAGYHAQGVADVETATALLESDAFDVVFTRLLGLTPLNGFDLLRRVQLRWPQTAVIALTLPNNATERLIEARNLGAADALMLPCSLEELFQSLRRVLKERSLARHLTNTLDTLRERSRVGYSLAASLPLARILRELSEPNARDAHVLITGERGTGKSWMARTIHAHSPRGAGPFASMTCAGAIETSMRVALFGQRRGSSSSRGLFSELHGGTLHLTRISQAPRALLAELRAVLEQRVYQREGDERAWKADVRVLATSRQPIPDALWGGSNPLRIHLPALREQRETIPQWVDHFMNELAAEGDDSPLRLGDGVVDALMRRDYPGNLTELRGTLQHLARYAQRGVIELRLLRELAP